MTGFVMKLVISPIAVYLASFFFPRLIHYPALYQPIAAGIIIVLVDHIMEFLLLRRNTVWVNTAVDFAAAFIVLYLFSSIFPGARVTGTGAFLTAGILTVTEHLQHLYLVKSSKTVK